MVCHKTVIQLRHESITAPLRKHTGTKEANMPGWLKVGYCLGRICLENKLLNERAKHVLGTWLGLVYSLGRGLMYGPEYGLDMISTVRWSYCMPSSWQSWFWKTVSRRTLTRSVCLLPCFVGLFVKTHGFSPARPCSFPEHQLIMEPSVCLAEPIANGNKTELKLCFIAQIITSPACLSLSDI